MYNVLINRLYLKSLKKSILLKTSVFKDMIFICISPTVEDLLERLYFKFMRALNSYTRDKEASSSQLNILTFRHNFANMVNSFVVSLHVSVMVNIS